MNKRMIWSLIVAVPVAAYAMVSGDQSPRLQSALVYDSGSVASGAAIDSGVLDVSRYSVCTAFTDSSAGSQRLVVFVGYQIDGSTVLFNGTTGTGTGGTANTPASSYGIFTVGIGASTAGITNASVYVLPPKMQFKMNAAGTGAGRVTVYCR